MTQLGGKKKKNRNFWFKWLTTADVMTLRDFREYSLLLQKEKRKKSQRKQVQPLLIEKVSSGTILKMEHLNLK